MKDKNDLGRRKALYLQYMMIFKFKNHRSTRQGEIRWEEADNESRILGRKMDWM